MVYKGVLASYKKSEKIMWQRGEREANTTAVTFADDEKNHYHLSLSIVPNRLQNKMLRERL